jgi:hypothetical protein
MVEISPETQVAPGTRRSDAELDSDTNYDRVVYPLKRTPGKSIIWDFFDQNLKSDYYRRLLHEGK